MNAMTSLLSRTGLAVAAGLLVIAGCATQSGFIKDKEGAAVNSALARGKFDLHCPNATGTVLSSSYLPPEESGPAAGLKRAQFAIGVAGCDKRTTYTVLCPDKTDTCSPATPDGK
jgi:hypothetical protein